MKRWLLAGLLLLVAAPAVAQGLCGDHEKMVAHLDKKFGEIRTNMGMSSNGGVLEVYTNLESGTWTILHTMPGGPTCLIGAGDLWETLTPKKQIKGTVS